MVLIQTSQGLGSGIVYDTKGDQGTIGRFLTYEEAVAAARGYVLGW